MLTLPSRLSQCLLIGALIGLAVGCSSTRSQFLAPEYEQGTIRGSSIALLPLSSELGLVDTTAENGQDLQAAYFTDEGQKLFYRLFDLELEKVASARVASLGSSFRLEDTPLQMQMLALSSKDSLRIPLPSEQVQTPDEQADFLLLIDELTFKPRSETVRAGHLGSTKRRNDLYITATCQYVLWDNKRARAAAYGRFEGSSRMSNPNSRAPYETLFTRLAIHIIEESPIALSPQIKAQSTGGV